MNLSLDTLLVLTLRTEPSVYYSVFHFTSEKIYFFRQTNYREMAEQSRNK